MTPRLDAATTLAIIATGTIAFTWLGLAFHSAVEKMRAARVHSRFCPCHTFADDETTA